MNGVHIDAHRVYIVWSGFRETTTRPPTRDVNPTWLVEMLVRRTRAKTLPELAGHLGMLKASTSCSYDVEGRRVLCNVDRYHTSHLALWLARAIVERHELACSVSRVQHALLARYHPELANAWRPSAVS